MFENAMSVDSHSLTALNLQQMNLGQLGFLAVLKIHKVVSFHLYSS